MATDPSSGLDTGAERARPSTDASAGDATGEDRARAQIGRTEQAEAESRASEGRAAKAVRAFDLRRVIGGLFAVYGVVLTILGVTASEADRAKAVGINVNLWAGLAMIALALLFLGWAWWRPLRPQQPGPDRAQEPRGRAPAAGEHEPARTPARDRTS